MQTFVLMIFIGILYLILRGTQFILKFIWNKIQLNLKPTNTEIQCAETISNIEEDFSHRYSARLDQREWKN